MGKNLEPFAIDWCRTDYGRLSGRLYYPLWMDMNGCFLTAEWPFHVEHCKATFDHDTYGIWTRAFASSFFKHRYAEVARFAEIHPVGQRIFFCIHSYTCIHMFYYTYMCSIHSHMTCMVNYLHRTRERTGAHGNFTPNQHPPQLHAIYS